MASKDQIAEFVEKRNQQIDREIERFARENPKLANPRTELNEGEKKSLRKAY